MQNLEKIQVCTLLLKIFPNRLVVLALFIVYTYREPEEPTDGTDYKYVFACSWFRWKSLSTLNNRCIHTIFIFAIALMIWYWPTCSEQNLHV
ncbi:hypothetical protein GDO78_009260 [Eleutherodactylus coqui]|uniref:Uncharacterized protein n=1 Tax=Eleutherodactylus coqui TaxID=57060 RepID=A0A8J6FAS7_ELECQ|nr:hypothetical protein GDO78_009260 [Eleutherodactylus coqui]